MINFISILIILVCVLLCLVILIQNSKGGGLTGNLSSNNQILGARQTTNLIEKLTWGFAAALFVFCLFASPAKNDGTAVNTGDSVTKRKASEMRNTAPATNPVTPGATVPAQPAAPQGN